MKTTFLPAFAVALALILTPQTNRASTQPVLDQEGQALEEAPAATLASAELQPGPAKVAGRNVNVRSKATIQSEVITQMQDGDDVFVEEVILRPEAKGKDPARWAKIAYPSNASAWVHSHYVDAATGTVEPKKLNVRSGPGENHAIVGGLHAGDTVVQLGSKGDWLLIKPPEGATAYIAAKLLRQEIPSEEVVAVTETEVMETEMVGSQPEVAEGGEASEPERQGTESGGEATAEAGGKGAEELAMLPEEPPVLEPVPAEPLPPRIVAREGIVGTFTEPHAPSRYKLVSADNGRLINYLYTTSTNLDLGRYVGMHIIATGEEGLDQRWRTPVLTLRRIVLVDLDE